MKIAIIIPAVNCLEYTKKTIKSIKTKYDHQIIFIDDGSTDGTKEWAKEQNMITYTDPRTGSLAGNWNLGIKRGLQENCDLFLIINNDIILSPTTIDNLVKKIETKKYVLVSAVDHHEGFDNNPEKMMDNYVEYVEDEKDCYHPDFSCFMISKDTINKIGYFDENFFVAYFEDNDYHARIVLSGEKAIATTSALFYHFGSITANKNKSLTQVVADAFDNNKEYFKDKYGCYPVHNVDEMLEKYYKHPFNDKSRSLKDTELYVKL